MEIGFYAGAFQKKLQETPVALHENDYKYVGRLIIMQASYFVVLELCMIIAGKSHCWTRERMAVSTV